jgi:hypothetical protein
MKSAFIRIGRRTTLVDMRELRGKLAVVTGATDGIGNVSARAMDLASRIWDESARLAGVDLALSAAR